MADTVYGSPSFESMYMGSYSPLEPEYGSLFTGYRVPFSRIAATTNPTTAAQINEVTSKLSEGMKAIEVGAISPEVFETIPKQHIKEIERLGKLTGAEFSLHAPIIDPAGFTKEGWSEMSKAESETRFKNVIERAHGLSPQGNIPVVFHATAGVPSTKWQVIEGKPEVKELFVVNQETGAIDRVEREMRYFPKEEPITPNEALDMKNASEWDRHLMPLVDYAKGANALLEEAWPVVAPKWKEISEERQNIIEQFRQKKINEFEANKRMQAVNESVEPELQPFFNKIQMAQNYYGEIGKHLAALYDKAYKYAPGTKEEKGKIKQIIANKAESFENAVRLREFAPAQASSAFHDLIMTLKKIPPETYVTAEDFALKHSRETIADTALHAYRKYGDKAPILAIENFFAGTVFSRGEDLARLIKSSREEFVERAKKTGISESKARQTAEKLIGATWDVGHINLLKKHGFGVKDGKYDEKEFKKIMAAETKAVAPYVKHVHLTDNFGFEDSHLPPGMGEVPLKEMLKELEKAGYKGREVIEAGGWINTFKTSPMPYALETLGSPIYGAKMQPFWNQVRGSYGVPAGYSAGYGLMLPEQHLGTYGAGFSSVPIDLGGRMPGKGQQFSGAPME